ncbi:MAG TPA: methyltransferase domain-containing protein [Micromonosporaceae bacterium]|nr:methyltransferase domain-containing protein [Micromonosporaceae bacterium]
MAVARYDAVADDYAAGSADVDRVMLELLDLVEPVHGQRVLDLACGHGRVARELARRGATVTGLDLSEALLDKAIAMDRAHPLGITYVHGDASANVELPDQSFDAVVCNFGLSDIDDLDGALGTVHRVLRRDGGFGFAILHPCFAGGATVSGAWPTDGSYRDEGYWVADGAASLLRRRVGANHRTLSTYVNTLGRHGLGITAIREPAPPAEWAADERRAAAGFPVFLVARCRNESTDGTS